MAVTDEQFDFVLVVLENTEMNPDWKAVAAQAGITLAGSAQAKFRKIVQASGYKLVNGNKVVRSDDNAPATNAATAIPSKKRKSPTKKATKGETNQEATNGDASEDATSESPIKKKKASRSAGGKAVEGVENEVKEEVEGEDGA